MRIRRQLPRPGPPTVEPCSRRGRHRRCSVRLGPAHTHPAPPRPSQPRARLAAAAAAVHPDCRQPKRGHHRLGRPAAGAGGDYHRPLPRHNHSSWGQGRQPGGGSSPPGGRHRPHQPLCRAVWSRRLRRLAGAGAGLRRGGRERLRASARPALWPGAGAAGGGWARNFHSRRRQQHRVRTGAAAQGRKLCLHSFTFKRLVCCLARASRILLLPREPSIASLSLPSLSLPPHPLPLPRRRSQPCWRT